MFQIVLKKHIYIGWKIFVIGVFLVSFGGDIEFLLGIIKKQAKYMWVMKHQQISKTGIKIMMYWIHGSVLHYGLSQHWAGLIKMQQISNVIIQQMRL